MWTIVSMGYDGPDKVYGVFNNPDVAHAWALDNKVQNAWVMKVERPHNLADLFLIEQKEAW